MVEDEDEQQELHRAFYEDVDGRVGDCLRGAHDDDYAYADDDHDAYANYNDDGHNNRPYDHGTVRKHPHEVDSEVSAHSLRGYDDVSRRRAQQQRQLDKWSKQKHSSKARHTRHDSLESPNEHTTHSREEHRRWKSAPAPPFTEDSNYNEYDNDDSNYDVNNYYAEHDDGDNEAAIKASSKQKRTIETYVQRVIANADSDEYVTPLPRMDSGFSQHSQNSQHSNNSNDKDNLLPLPGFGEVDLLQRAIERRAILHDRIVKMEEASAQFAREEEERSERYQQQRQQQKQRNHREQKHQYNHHQHSSKERKRRPTVEEAEDDRMNEISQRIKAEALEFLNHSFDDYEDNTTTTNSAQEDNLTQDSSCETKDSSDEENEGGNTGSKLDPPEEIGETNEDVRGRRQLSDQQSSGSGSIRENVAPTSHQLARYGNMVRLGIPDMAVLRSMDRDGIDSTRASSILEDLKQQHAQEERLDNAPSDELSETGKTPNKETNPRTTSTAPSSLRSLVTDMAKSPKQTIISASQPPLKDDPDYNKYFKMLKAKVPLSWVKRVLEVDGKDARVLDLDPDVPLQRQITLDEYGNIDWDKVVRFRSGSESSGDELMGKSPNKRSSGVSSATKLQLETTDRVKAELAIMTAKAGRLSRESSRQSSLSDSSTDAREIKPNPADISSAAAAASNARLNRLKAMTTPDRHMRRKQSVDEIRRRPPPPPPRPKPHTPQHTPQHVPPSPSPSSTASERAVAARRQTYDHLPLKDDPRFSKYFQMIRSRVPRSWVERVIEVDDRDPAILDLDPNKPLAAQVEDDEMKSVVKTLGTSETDGSLDESVRSGAVSRSSDVYQVKNDLVLTPTEEVPTDEVPPITQIVNAVDDERSIASSITNFKDGTGSQAEQSNAVLDRISAFLDKIESRSRNATQAAAASIEEQTPGETPDDIRSRRLSSPEDIENKLTSLIERFDSRGSQVQSLEEAKEATTDEQQQFIAENQSDITKLTSLLASKLGQQPEGISATNETSDLAKLSNLLTEVLAKMDEPSTAEKEDQETTEPVKDVSTPKKLGRNAALESLFAKRAALSEEKGPPILREDPEYEKYFKMQKVGMPRPVIEQALERDGKDVSILDLDPERPLADQQKEKKTKPNKNAALEALFAKRAAALQPTKKDDVPLKNDPEYQKYFKMLKVGMPRDAVVQALERDGKSGSILDLDPEKPYATQTAEKSGDNMGEKKSDVPIKDDPEYAKFFKVRGFFLVF